MAKEFFRFFFPLKIIEHTIFNSNLLCRGTWGATTSKAGKTRTIDALTVFLIYGLTIFMEHNRNACSSWAHLSLFSKPFLCIGKECVGASHSTMCESWWIQLCILHSFFKETRRENGCSALYLYQWRQQAIREEYICRYHVNHKGEKRGDDKGGGERGATYRYAI